MKYFVNYHKDCNELSRTREQVRQAITINYEGTKSMLNAMGKEMIKEEDGAMVFDKGGVDTVHDKMRMQKGDNVSYNIAEMVTMKAKKLMRNIIKLK